MISLLLKSKIDNQFLCAYLHCPFVFIDFQLIYLLQFNTKAKFKRKCIIFTKWLQWHLMKKFTLC